jgi:hypothetical protein
LFQVAKRCRDVPEIAHSIGRNAVNAADAFCLVDLLDYFRPASRAARNIVSLLMGKNFSLCFSQSFLIQSITSLYKS